MKLSIPLRAILSAMLFLAWCMLNWSITTIHPLVVGRAAVSQLDNNDFSYMAAYATMNAFPVRGLSSLFLLAILAMIWWKPIRTTMMLLPLGLLCLPVPAYAYYDTKDYPEYVEIAPDQSAFLIPVAGANKDSQAQFGSAAYLEAVKVPLKRIQIPHTLIRNPGWSSDYYVPAAKLIIVPRSPFQREWSAGTRGTNATKDESFHTDTSDGINISMDVSIAASVREEDTAVFLYNFGTKALSGRSSSI